MAAFKLERHIYLHCHWSSDSLNSATRTIDIERSHESGTTQRRGERCQLSLENGFYQERTTSHPCWVNFVSSNIRQIIFPKVMTPRSREVRQKILGKDEEKHCCVVASVFFQRNSGLYSVVELLEEVKHEKYQKHTHTHKQLYFYLLLFRHMTILCPLLSICTVQDKSEKFSARPTSQNLTKWPGIFVVLTIFQYTVEYTMWYFVIQVHAFTIKLSLRNWFW